MSLNFAAAGGTEVWPEPVLHESGATRIPLAKSHVRSVGCLGCGKCNLIHLLNFPFQLFFVFSFTL